MRLVFFNLRVKLTGIFLYWPILMMDVYGSAWRPDVELKDRC